ncbi:MAG TPA: biofilm regulation phosphoprotein SiaC [Candidatus Competibacteraceae bacterium]|nr:biofilm regulation phosphoprotein SiaC [Candidatus Competibacteraceae bacterium]
MIDLNIAGTSSSPAIVSRWAEGTLEMRGDSYPENSFELYQPVFDWVKRYLETVERPLTLNLYLLYLNTSSIKSLMDILDLLEQAHGEGRPVAVNWYYDQDNERVAELAEEFKEDCSFPFAIIGYSPC